MNTKIKLILGILLLAFAIWATPKIIKKFNQVDLVEMGNVPEFSLTNQHKKTITNKDYLGKVYVVEFFFSTCPTICPIMNQNMMKVAKAFENDTTLKILSHTVKPEEDSIPVLLSYAKQHNANSENWWFLTGDKKGIYSMARNR